VSSSLLDLSLVWVTGKGGVGKTTVAAALGEVAARRGLRTLVCEMDAKGALSAAYDGGELGFEPTLVDDGVYAMTMNTEDSLREYLRIYVRIPLLGRIGPLASTFDFVADAAPGVKEILGVGKLCYEVRERHYDIVIVDAESTGHVISQVGAPRVIADLIKVGLVHDQTRWMLDILEDPEQTGVVVVTTPEEMPVTESIELLGRLHPEAGAHPCAVVANRVLPQRFTKKQAAVVDDLEVLRDELVDELGPAFGQVLDATRLTEARRRSGTKHLGRLTEWCRDHGLGELPRLTVDEQFAARALGPRVVSVIADLLDAQLDPAGGSAR
jgi:anion-transporting  ArsA/GET3 family ATPase